MTIELTPMIAARIVELAREHEETPDAVVCRVLASCFFGDEELDEVLDEIDVAWWEKEKGNYDPSQNIPFAQFQAELDAMNRGDIERVTQAD